MAAGHLSNEEFFSSLSKLFESRSGADHGSVYLSQKRLTYDSPTSTASGSLADLHPSSPLPILIRASNGKGKGLDGKYHRNDKLKMSTVVQPDAIDAFYARYAEVCKAGMLALQKRDRSKRKKAKKGKKKGEGVEKKA